MKLSLGVSVVVISMLIGCFALSRPSVHLALLRSPAVQPVVMQALGNATDSEAHAKYFFYLIRQHQYAEARSLMTPAARKLLSTHALQGQWAAFESVHGRVTLWSEAGITTNLLPEYVDRRYQVSGSRGSASLMTLRLTRPPGSGQSISSWQVDSLTTSR